MISVLSFNVSSKDNQQRLSEANPCASKFIGTQQHLDDIIYAKSFDFIAQQSAAINNNPINLPSMDHSQSNHLSTLWNKRKYHLNKIIKDNHSHICLFRELICFMNVDLSSYKGNPTTFIKTKLRLVKNLHKYRIIIAGSFNMKVNTFIIGNTNIKTKTKTIHISNQLSSYDYIGDSYKKPHATLIGSNIEGLHKPIYTELKKVVGVSSKGGKQLVGGLIDESKLNKDLQDIFIQLNEEGFLYKNIDEVFNIYYYTDKEKYDKLIVSDPEQLKRVDEKTLKKIDYDNIIFPDDFITVEEGQSLTEQQKEDNKQRDMVQVAFSNINNDNNEVYLVVYGDPRYPGGGYINSDHIPKSQEEQVFIYTSLSLLSLDNDYTKNCAKVYEKVFEIKTKRYDENNINVSCYSKPKTGLYLMLFEPKMCEKLFNGKIYLIQGNIHKIRNHDETQTVIENPERGKKINIIYACAPLYHDGMNTNGEYDEEKIEKNLKQYKDTVMDILQTNFGGNEKKKKILLFGNFGMGVFLEKGGPKSGSGFTKQDKTRNNTNIIRYIKALYTKFIVDTIKDNGTVFDQIYLFNMEGKYDLSNKTIDDNNSTIKSIKKTNINIKDLYDKIFGGKTETKSEQAKPVAKGDKQEQVAEKGEPPQSGQSQIIEKDENQLKTDLLNFLTNNNFKENIIIMFNSWCNDYVNAIRDYENLNFAQKLQNNTLLNIINEINISKYYYNVSWNFKLSTDQFKFLNFFIKIFKLHQMGIIFNKFIEKTPEDQKLYGEEHTDKMDMTKDAFYEIYAGFTRRDTIYYLTNGINKEFKTNEGGTNAAITNISKEISEKDKQNTYPLFYANLTLIYNPIIDSKSFSRTIKDHPSAPEAIFAEYVLKDTNQIIETKNDEKEKQKEKQKKESEDEKNIRIAREKFHGKPAGTVILANSYFNENDKTQNPNIDPKKRTYGGVFHVNGINWKLIVWDNVKWNQESKEEKQKEFRSRGGDLAADYYDAIIKSIYNGVQGAKPIGLEIVNIKTNKYNKYYEKEFKNIALHLAQIPGKLFDGGDEVYDGMFAAIYANKDIINQNTNVKISIDFPDYQQYFNKNKTQFAGLFDETTKTSEPPKKTSKPLTTTLTSTPLPTTPPLPSFDIIKTSIQSIINTIVDADTKTYINDTISEVNTLPQLTPSDYQEYKSEKDAIDTIFQSSDIQNGITNYLTTLINNINTI
jgi:phenolic acid decarboxylase